MAGEDTTVSAGIKLILDKQEIDQSLERLKRFKAEVNDVRARGVDLSGVSDKFKDISASVKNAASSLNDFAGKAVQAAAKFTAFAAAGAIGGGFAAAAAYGQQRQGMEQAANDFIRAQKEVSTAFADIGRVTARLATPALETLANAIEVVADALDQLIPPQDSNPFDKFITETIPAAILSAERLLGSFEGLAAIVGRGAGNAIDGFVTGLRKIGIDIGAFLKTLSDKLGDFLDALFGLIPENVRQTLGLPGPRGFRVGGAASHDEASPEIQKQLLDEELQGRIQGRNDAAAAVGSRLGKTDQDTQNGISAFRRVYNAAGQQVSDNTDNSKEFAQAYIDFRKAQRESDKQYNAERSTLTTEYNKAEKKAKTDHQLALQQLDKEQAKAERDLTSKYNDDREKAAADFHHNEAQTEERANLDRLRRLREHQDRLTDFAANRDVAGFVTEQRNFQHQEQAQNEQEALEKKQRADAFAQANADRDKQYHKELADLKQQGQDKRNELNAQFNREENERRQAYQDQLTLLRNKHDQERTAIETHYAEQLASLTGNVAGLQGIQAGYYAQALIDANNFVQQNKAKLQELYGATFGGGTADSAQRAQLMQSTDYTSTFTASPSIMNQLANLPSFDVGGRIPRDMIIKAHKDEVIFNPHRGQVPGGTTHHWDFSGADFGGGDPEAIKRAVMTGVIQAHQMAREAL